MWQRGDQADQGSFILSFPQNLKAVAEAEDVSVDVELALGNHTVFVGVLGVRVEDSNVVFLQRVR